LAQLFAQHSVLFPKVVDQLQLLLVHPAGHCVQQEPERVQGFRHEEGNIITGSPAVHSPVGDPLQIYADRFSGHYGAKLRQLHWLCPLGWDRKVVSMTCWIFSGP
jgi:hypothetical protein